MSAPAEMRALAAKVLACERARHPDAPDRSVAMLAAFRGLRAAMTQLVGASGFDALLRRAVQLARREQTWLERVPLGSSVELDHLAEQARTTGEPEATEGAITLFATVLDLFCTFIGGELTLRQVHQVWNELPPVTSTSAEEPK